MFIDDPKKEVLRRIKELTRTTAKPDIDEKETAEREGAAQAYAGENEKHFIDYGNDCVQTSVKAMKKIRQTQNRCWSAYNEDPPPNYSQKEDWQSKIVVPKPYGAVQFAMAVVRKAFSADFLSVQNESKQAVADFWERLLQHQFNQNHADFAINFTDATGMGFAVGQSLEMIPQWVPGKGLKFILVEPWKIHRDPDAISRHPQSGMYWIHQEYIDMHVLKKKQESGVYINIDALGEYFSPGDNEDLTKEQIAERKNLCWERSTFRKAPLVSEFWGEVISPSGEMLLPSSRYTWSGNRVIRLPENNPYKKIRWPGISFSPLPHFLRHDGRGLLQGVLSLWDWMCTLMSLHSDSLNWLVNPPAEMDISAFVDPDDVDDYPGKRYLTRGTVSGQQAVRTVERKNITNEVLPNMNFGDQLFQRGTFITDLVQGLPGWRAEVTARESAQSLEQAMNVFSLMGMNLEHGAIQVTEASADIIANNIGYHDLLEIFSEEDIAGFIDKESPTDVKLPELTGGFHISGISAIMKDTEVIKTIRDLILPLCIPDGPFIKYIKPYNILRSIERRANLVDEKILVEEPEAQEIQEMDKTLEAEREANNADMHKAEADKLAREAMEGGEEKPEKGSQGGASQ